MIVMDQQERNRGLRHWIRRNRFFSGRMLWSTG